MKMQKTFLTLIIAFCWTSLYAMKPKKRSFTEATKGWTKKRPTNLEIAEQIRRMEKSRQLVATLLAQVKNTSDPACHLILLLQQRSSSSEANSCKIKKIKTKK